MRVMDADIRRRTLHQRIRLIVSATIGYNVVEAVVALAAGSVASSAALVGFGLDSTIEVLSAAAVAWQFTRRDPERWERPALRAIALVFFALAAYVTASAVFSLVSGTQAEHSPVGIVLAAVSIVIMPFLSYAERRTGLELGSATAVADSKQTLICAYLSAAVLLGLGANALLGWWWADALAGLIIAVFALREGLEAWKGDACATSVGMVFEHDPARQDEDCSHR